MYKIIIPSPYAKALTEKLLPNKPISYIEIGFDHRTEEIKREINNIFLFVGTLEPRKGIQHILDVAAIFKERGIKANFRIVGNQKYKEYVNMLKNFAIKENLQESVTFIGRLNDDELEAEYKNASFFLFPSLHEGYGMVLVEAMSYCLPVVAFDNSAMPYTITDGKNGLLAKNMNSNDLAEKAISLINNKEQYSNIAHQAFIYAQSKPSRTEMIEKMTALVQTL
jgi:glycosyltransferase involved in cell wall biosynthesis